MNPLPRLAGSSSIQQSGFERRLLLKFGRSKRFEVLNRHIYEAHTLQKGQIVSNRNQTFRLVRNRRYHTRLVLNVVTDVTSLSCPIMLINTSNCD